MSASSRIPPAWRAHVFALLFLAAPAALAQEFSPEPARENAHLLAEVPYITTPDEAVYRMLEMAGVLPDDYVIDLGSGDGRIVIAAVRDWGARNALGIEIDPALVLEATENATLAGVADRVRFEQADLFTKDFSDVDVLTMYLSPSLNMALRPVILEKLRPGARVLSHAFDMGEWRPDEYILVQGRYLYKWVVPARVEGRWDIERPDGTHFIVDLSQRFQRIEGMAHFSDRDRPLVFADIRGDTIRFSLAGEHYTGRVEGNRIVSLPGNRVVTGWHAKRS